MAHAQKKGLVQVVVYTYQVYCGSYEEHSELWLQHPKKKTHDELRADVLEGLKAAVPPLKVRTWPGVRASLDNLLESPRFLSTMKKLGYKKMRVEKGVAMFSWVRPFEECSWKTEQRWKDTAFLVEELNKAFPHHKEQARRLEEKERRADEEESKKQRGLQPALV